MTSKQLIEARRKLGLSINEMALVMGAGRSVWVKWARGERKPSATAIKMVRHLLWLHENHPGVLSEMLQEDNFYRI